MTRVGLLVLLAACSSAPASVAPPARPRVSSSEALHLPDDAYAVIGVELDALRQSPVWPLVRDYLVRDSSLALSCPEALAAAHHATIALRQGEHVAATEVVVLRGVERARLMACLRGPPGAGVSWVPPASAHPAPCAAFDAAVNDLEQCRRVPLSFAAPLATVRGVLASNPPDVAAACTRANDVVAGARARVTQLGTACELHHRDRDAAPIERVQTIDADTLALDGEQLLHFVDDHTLVVLRGGSRDSPGIPELTAELAVMRAHSRTPHWSDAARAALDAHRAVWFAARPDTMFGPPDSHGALPALLWGTLDLRDGLSAELRATGVSGFYAGELAGLAEHVLAEPSFHAVTARASCVEPPPSDARTRRCAEVLAHTASFQPAGAAATLYASVAADSELARCAEQPWSDAYVTCLAATTSASDVATCYNALPVTEQTALSAGAICGGREAQLQLDFPLLPLEGLKLEDAVGVTPTIDCAPPVTRAAPTAVVELTATPDETFACFQSGASPLCWTLDPHAPSPSLQPLDGAGPASRPCTGPYEYLVPGFEPRSPVPQCDAGRATAMVNVRVEDHVIHVCDLTRGTCAALPPPSKLLRAVTVDEQARHAAIVFGDAGAQRIETWDLAVPRAPRRIATWSAGTTRDRPCGRAVFVGPSLLVSTGGCAPDAEPNPARLVTIHGAPIAAAPPDAMPVVDLGGQRWAFVARTGDRVIVQNVATGAVEPAIATGTPADLDRTVVTTDGAGHLVLAYGGAGPRAGTVTTLDLKSHALVTAAAVACPAGTVAPR